MGIAQTFSPLGTYIPDRKSGALALSILATAGAGAAHAAPINMLELDQQDRTALGLSDTSLAANSLAIAGFDTYGLASDFTLSPLSFTTTETKPAWDDILPGSSYSDLFKSEFADQIAAIQAAAEARRASVAETLELTQNGGDNIVYATFEPVGVESGQTPLTFTHVSNAVGILEQELPSGEMKRSVTAHVGIDTAGSVFEQVTADPRGIHPVGDLVTTADEDIRISENARVSALFTPEQGAIEELQIGVGYDMQPNENIEIILRDGNGEVVRTIDANEFQVIPDNNIQDAETRDYLVLLIKDDAEALATIYDNMQAGGTFNVEAFSPMGRKGLSEFTFGETFAADLDAGYAQLAQPGFAFDADTAFKRRVAYDPNAEPIDHDLAECVILGLDQLPESERQDIRVIFGEVTDGTGTLTRNFIAKVALDAEDNVVAFGSEAMWGANMDTNTLRLSGSIETGFITNGGQVLNGCTDDQITGIVPPSQPGVPFTGIPGVPHVGTPGSPTGGGTPYFPWNPHNPLFPLNPDNPTTITPETPATVDAPPTWVLMLTGLGILGAASHGPTRRGAINLANQALGRREEEYSTPAAAV